MSLIGYARVSTAEGRQWQASTCLPPSSSTGTPPGWAKRSLGEDMPACPWSPSSCHTSRPSVGPTSCSPANTDGKNAELSLTCHFALFRNRPLQLGSQSFLFGGHAEYIGGTNDEFGNQGKGWILAQPQFTWDLGAVFGAADQLLVGVEYQYWRNKLGVDEDDNVPQLLVIWRF